MSRADETRKFIEGKRTGFYVQSNEDKNKYAVMCILGNIAMSLAIIADKLTEGDNT